MLFMFTIANQSIINIRFDTDTDQQNAKNVRKFEFRGHGFRITLNKTDRDSVQKIMDLINSYPRLESHYCKKKTT